METLRSRKTTIKQLKNYFKNELEIKPKHDLAACKKAFNELNKELNVDVYNLICLIFENKPIDQLYTHSYGFHTGNGRYIIYKFKKLYYNNLNS